MGIDNAGFVARLRSLPTVVLAAAFLTSTGALSGWQIARADGSVFVPQTKLRVTVTQWMPTKGVYERLDGIGGEFTVSENRTLSLPVIGSLSLDGLDLLSLAGRISEQLRQQTGLLKMPDVSVQIVDRPPIYVVGDVEKPGEYNFRDGLTALQALAMSGGRYRTQDASEQALNTLGFAGQLREIGNMLVRSEIRIVRLEAERSRAAQIVYDPRFQPDPGLARTVFEHEKMLFTSRKNEIDRQAKSYLELRSLLTLEIENLQKKVVNADEDIAALQTQAGKVKGLVEKGIFTPSRQQDIERMLRSYFADRLDLETSIMRARQNLSEANRNLDGLHDRQETEIATALQAEQANLDQLKMKRELTQALLMKALSRGEGPDHQTGADPTFIIVRRENSEVREIAATSAALLAPGDVVRVSFSTPEPDQHGKQVRGDEQQEMTERRELGQ